MNRYPIISVISAGLFAVTIGFAADGPTAPKIGFDNQGCADLAVGVFSDIVGGEDAAGAVNVIYGTVADDGLGFPGNQRLHQNLAAMPAGTAASAFDHFGAALATGDFNHDYFVDLAVGVPFQEVEGEDNAGEVNIFYGGPGGISASGSQVFSQEGTILGVPKENERLGGELCVGDFNGDRYDDLALGIAGDRIDGLEGVGAVNVIYGSAAGLTATGNRRFWQGEGLQGAPEAHDSFGAAVAAGDFDGDGYDDLAVGATGQDIDGPTRQGAGVVHIIFGSAGGLTDVGDLMWSQDTVGGVGAGGTSEGFGSELGVGDFDGDGFDDLAIGAHRDSSVATQAGAVNVAYGSPSGFDLVRSQLWHQDQPGMPENCGEYDFFGRALGVGDFDGDGFDDLAIGVPFEDLSPPAANEGVVHVLYGTSAGLTTTGTDYWRQGLGSITDPAEDQDNFGDALAAGDFNCDGFDELAIAAPRETLTDYDVGMVHVLPGAIGGLIHSGNQVWYQGHPDLAGVADPFDNFGYALASFRVPYLFADGFESGDTEIWD